MAKGSWTATTSSALIVPANAHRGQLIVQFGTGEDVYLGIGEAAVSGEGIKIGSFGIGALSLTGVDATKAIYAITASDTGGGSYQELAE